MNENDVDANMADDWAAAEAEIDGAEETVEETVEDLAEAVETDDSDVDPELAEALAETEEGEEETEASDPAKDMEALKKLAEKLGLTVNDKGLTKRDLAAFTDKKRRLHSQYVKRNAELDQKVHQFNDYVRQKEAPLTAFQQALQAQDLDGIAKIAGFESWNDLQAVQLKRMSDPGYHEVSELKKTLEKERQEKERQIAEQTARQAENERAQKLHNYKIELSKQAEASKDPLAKAMAQDRMFVETVFSVQKDLVDPLTGKTVSVEEALDVELPNGRTLRQNLKAHYDRLVAVFGKPEAPAIKDNPAGLKNAKTKEIAPAQGTKPAVKKSLVTKKVRSERENDLAELNAFARQMAAVAKKER